MSRVEKTLDTKHLKDYGLLIGAMILLVSALMLFISSPPPIDIYNDYDYVDVILTKNFVITGILYLLGVFLTVVNVVRMWVVKQSSLSILRRVLRIMGITVFVAVSFYILGYLGFYETLDIHFKMPFRLYHPPF